MKPMQLSIGRARGFTLIEVLVGTAVGAIVSVAIFAFLYTSSYLSAKNLALNLTSNTVRGSLDRVDQTIQSGDNAPSLITVTGTAAGNGPAAGVKFDQFIGSPYVITAPSSGLAASATSLVLTRSTAQGASAPLPRIGDTIRIDSTATTLRPYITAVSAGAVNPTTLRQSVTVTLNAPLGTPVPLVPTGIMSSKLVRSVAFIVIPKNGRNELRLYGAFDMTTNLNDPLSYNVITDQIGLLAADATPFSIVQKENKPFTSFSLRVRAGGQDAVMANDEAGEFNTFTRIEALLRPRINL